MSRRIRSPSSSGSPQARHLLLEVNGVVVGYVDDALGDLIFQLEDELRQERHEAPEIG